MLTLLFLLLLAPFGVLARPASFSLGQLVFQLPGSPVSENDVAAPQPPALQVAPPTDSALQDAPPTNPAIRVVHQFDDLRLENLHSRPNGSLVLSVINKPVLYTLDPTKPNAKPVFLYEFPGATAMLGQAEIAPDVFAVVAGNWSQPGTHTPGSFSVWSIDLNTPGKPKVKQIAAIPEANALNGMTALHGGSPDIVLIADSVMGALWKLNVTSGEYKMAFASPLFTNTTGPIGINGIRSFEGSVYFFNSGQGSYGRVPVTYDGEWAGEVQILARIDTDGSWDDFDMDWEGNAWVATHQSALMEVTVQGKMRNTTGDGTFTMANPTSARFGRGSKEQEKTLYLSAAGDRTHAGQVIAVQTWLM